MISSNRRKFLQTSGVLLATVFYGDLFALGKNKPLLSFSTLGCPDWTFKQIVDLTTEAQSTQRFRVLILCNLKLCVLCASVFQNVALA